MTIQQIIFEHSHSAASQYLQREGLLVAPHVALRHIERIDNRLAANIDGLRVAGDAGWKMCLSQLENAGPGEIFIAAVLAVESKDPSRIAHVFALAEALPEAQSGLFAAFGWISSQFLQGTIKELLTSSVPFQRQLGIVCCALHRVDPGAALQNSIDDNYPPLRARALKAAGELGRVDLISQCETFAKNENIDVRFWAAWSAALLGSFKTMPVLSDFASRPGVHQFRALNIYLKKLSSGEAHEFLQKIAQAPANLRALIYGSGVAGDAAYIPWLIKQMADLKLSRLAGEAFSFITGVDLAYQDLERKPPQNFESGPNDNPADPNVDLDPDDNLPWPDVEKISPWWQQNSLRFQQGTHYFMGEPVARSHCMHILKEGFQRQRISAAQYLSLLQPGSMLFPTEAPSWRQQRLLAKLN